MTSERVPEGQYLEIGDGLRVHYHEAGEGPVVLFIHGSGPGGSGWSNFQQNYEQLAAQGFRCVVPDLIGYGYSSKPEDAQYSLNFLAETLMAFVDALGLERFHLVGNSLGGALCIKLALEEAQRVDRLVLMAPGGMEDREVYMGMRGIRSMLRAIFDPEGLSLTSMRKVFEKQLFDTELLDDNLLKQRLAIAETQPQAVFATSRVPDLSERLSEITQATLAFWGNEDQFCPVSGAAKLAEKIPNVRVLRLSRCGHWVMVEHQALFNRLCADFLKGEP